MRPDWEDESSNRRSREVMKTLMNPWKISPVFGDNYLVILNPEPFPVKLTVSTDITRVNRHSINHTRPAGPHLPLDP